MSLIIAQIEFLLTVQRTINFDLQLDFMYFIDNDLNSISARITDDYTLLKCTVTSPADSFANIKKNIFE